MLHYYRLLNVHESAAPVEIKRSYRLLAQKFHPDLNEGHPLAEQRFRLIAEAYSVLADSTKRQNYDQYGPSSLTTAGPAAGVAGSVGRLVSGLGSLIEARLKRTPKQGKDSTVKLPLSLCEAGLGTTKTIEVPSSQRCPTCTGNGRAPGTQKEQCHVCKGEGELRRRAILPLSDPCVFCQGDGEVAINPCADCQGLGQVSTTTQIEIEVPIAVETGRCLVLRGRGEPGQHGGPAGDLYVEIQIQKHQLLTKQGKDLHIDLPITIQEAINGAERDVLGLKGKLIRIRIPAGTSSGKVLRLRKRGIRAHDNAEPGDLMVHVKIETPRLKKGKQTAKLLEQLEKMADHPERDAYEKTLSELAK